MATILVNAFVQVNTIRGYRYIDDAGKIMAHFDVQFPEKKVNPDALQMINRDSPNREMQVSMERIWVHFEEPDTLTYIVDQSRKMVDTVCEIIDVTSFRRAGWRLQYLYSTDGRQHDLPIIQRRIFSEMMNQYIAGASPNNQGGFEVMVPLTAENLHIYLRISPVQRKSEGAKQSHLPRQGVLIDADIFRDEELSLPDFRRFMRDAEQWVRESLPVISDTFLPRR